MAKQVPHFVSLPDGRTVRYSIKQRPGDPFYFIFFRSPDGRRLEKSTKRTNVKQVAEAALPIITEVYNPGKPTEYVKWDYAIERLKEAWKGQNLRLTTQAEYLKRIVVLRKIMPCSQGPVDFTPNLCKQYKIKRMNKVSAERVASDIRTLNVIWGKWLINECELLGVNPWDDVEQPKCDQKAKRIIKDDERERFFNWLKDRFNGWTLPVLFYRVKSLIGCRIGELSRVKTSELRDGRIFFQAETTKGRQERGCLLPLEVFNELRAIAGETYLWESYTASLRRFYMAKGGRYRRQAKSLVSFHPDKLCQFLQKECVGKFRKANPDVPRFKGHNFRGTAMSKAKAAGVHFEDAAIAFDCNVATMQAYYVEFDQQPVSDDVFRRIQQTANGGKNASEGEMRGVPPSSDVNHCSEAG